MSTTPANPNVEAIRENVRNSDAELHQLIDGPLAHIDANKLYTTPAEHEWTIMQNLSHIVEFMPYWAEQIEKLVAEPGRNFGRTHQDEGRLRGITTHETDSLRGITAALPASYASLNEVLGSLNDRDLELTGKHVKFGEKPLSWFIEDFVTDHLSGHVEQIKRCLKLVG